VAERLVEMGAGIEECAPRAPRPAPRAPRPAPRAPRPAGGGQRVGEGRVFAEGEGRAPGGPGAGGQWTRRLRCTSLRFRARTPRPGALSSSAPASRLSTSAAPPLRSFAGRARARRRGGRACDAAHAGSNNENALALAELGRWTGLADWLRARMGLPLQPRAEAEAEARDFAALKEAAADRLSSSLLQHLATQPPGSRPRAAPRALRRRRRRGRPCSGPSELRKKNNCGLLV
jgi:hypothetical protein